MSNTRPMLRWLPTFLAFPVAGLATVVTVGSVGSAWSGLAAGAVAGAIVGGAQWLALRSSGVGRTWWLATVVGLALGTALAAILTDAGTSTGDLVLRGVVAGAAVGAAQASVLRPGLAVIAAWTATTSISWAAGWWVTSRVIVDAERGYVVFGSSGALVVTLLTGLALPLVLRAASRPALPTQDAADADLTVSQVAR